MVIAFLLIDDKKEISQFFEKTFLVIDISIDITLELSFLTLSNIEIYFTNLKLN